MESQYLHSLTNVYVKKVPVLPTWE